jgi:filamentous hemagglutinin family protein
LNWAEGRQTMGRQMTTDSLFPAISGSDLRADYRRLLQASVAACICLPVGATAQQAALPQGGQVASGTVSINTPSAGTMTITQGSDRAVVNWDSFSIGAGAHVDIRQPSSNAAMLNRVTGSTTSEIHGRLTANGQVHLVNPNGIFIGPTGTVDAGSFAASTLGISDGDFNAGRLQYRGTGSSATVENAGRVSIGRGGYAALLGGKVRNSGIVTVPFGRIGFASGERVVLDVSGDQFLQVALPSEGEDDGEALIDNSGTVSATGGLVEMRAATARNAARNAINLSGVAEASSVSVRGGTITLGGGDGGSVRVTGKVSTRSRPVSADVAVTQSLRPRARGGDITITGAKIALDGAQIDASGAGGGGSIRIGGDFAGRGTLPRAGTVSGDAQTVINADALERGDGGQIVLWSDEYTQFAGALSARGGAQGGDGGFVEVSSKLTLNYTGLADQRAPLGKWGMLLLDPTDIVVDPGAGGENMLEANLAFGDVILNTSGSGTGSGDITVNADVDWTAATTLTLIADDDGTTSGTGGNIALNGAINGASGGLRLDAVNQITTGAGGAINVGSFTLVSGVWTQNTATLPAFSADDFAINFGASFSRFVGGTGVLGDPFLVADIYGFQGLVPNGISNGFVALANDIDGSSTATWTEGFSPLFLSDGTFDLDGQGFSISNVFSAPDSGEGLAPYGLFSFLSTDSVVENLTLEGFTMIGSSGGLLAAFNEGTIRNVRASGTSSGTGEAVGGLVGENFGLIEDSIADVAVTADGSEAFGGQVFAGGFVGHNNFGTINRSHALGNVTVTDEFDGAEFYVGGFAGVENSNFGGTINDSYARGNVTVTSGTAMSEVYAGGFVGEINGDIFRSYSTGTVTVTGDAIATVGGFAATDQSGFSSADTNFWDIQTSGLATSAAGTGLSTAQFQDTETFISLGEVQGWDFANVWAPGDTGFYPVNYTTSPVILVTPDPLTLTYGSTTTAVSSGTINGGPDLYVFDDPADTLDADQASAPLTFADENVGTTTFMLDTASVTSDLGVIYRVVDRLGDAEITPAPLTITANDVAKTYGTLLAFDGTEFTVGGQLFFDDTVDSAALTSDGAAGEAAVNGGTPYAIAISDAVGEGIANYDITFEDGALTVDPAPLTITANDADKTYGTLLEFDGTEFTVGGQLFFDDAVETATLTSDGAAGEAAVNGGTPYAIAISDAVGAGLDNYDITFESGALTVDPAPLTVTANDANKTYGTLLAFDGTEFTVGGQLFFDDTVESATLTSDGAAGEAAVNGGIPYAIAISDAVGEGLDNYDITFEAGALTVDPAPLTITANDAVKTYGTLLAFDGTEFTVGGQLFFDDMVETATLSSDGAAQQAAVNGGSPYSIAISDAVGEGIDNYDITFESGALTVQPAPLTITANDAVKVFGTLLTFEGTEFTVIGLAVEGDSVDFAELNSEGAATSAVVADSPFPIEISAVEGNGLENYDVTLQEGALTVTPAVVNDVPVPPVFVGFPLPNPGDTIGGDFGTGGNDGLGGTDIGGAALLGAAEATFEKVDALSESLEIAADSCGQSSGDVSRYLACMSDSLNEFANELDAISSDLPPGMQNVARIVQDARVRVDQARVRAQQRLAGATTDAEREAIRRDAVSEARDALADAATEIRKSIALVRVEDPELATVQRATVTRVASAMDNVGIKMSRAVGL